MVKASRGSNSRSNCVAEIAQFLRASEKEAVVQSRNDLLRQGDFQIIIFR